MEFIKLEEAKKLSALPVEITETTHAKYGVLKSVRVFYQEIDDSGCWYSHKDYYLLA